MPFFAIINQKNKIWAFFQALAAAYICNSVDIVDKQLLTQVNGIIRNDK